MGGVRGDFRAINIEISRQQIQPDKRESGITAFDKGGPITQPGIYCLKNIKGHQKVTKFPLSGLLHEGIKKRGQDVKPDIGLDEPVPLQKNEASGYSAQCQVGLSERQHDYINTNKEEQALKNKIAKTSP